MGALAFDELSMRRAKHPAWRLLQHQNAPLVLGFLAEVFLDPNERVLPAPVVLDALEGFLDRIHDVDPDAYPRAAQSYLDEWADPQRGWLRRTLPAGEDVFVYEPTAAVETAAAFCRGLVPREFVGTASRLLTIRELLRTIVVGSQADPSARIAALERQRADLDVQLEAIRRGEDTQMDDTTIREHYQNIQATARALLADLRSVEENFRELDRQIRGKAVTWEGSRGAFLEDVFGTQAEIGESDQGRSWRAFWQHLLSSSAKTELNTMLDTVETLPALQGSTGEVETVLRRDLLRAATSTQRTAASVTGQLRRFLDDAEWAEGRRLNLIIRETLKAALTLADPDVSLTPAGAHVDELDVHVGLPAERPPYTARTGPDFDTTLVTAGNTDEVDLTELFDISHIDLDLLRDAISESLRARGGLATLGQVVAEHPLTDGLAELVGYLQLQQETFAEHIGGVETVSWTDELGTDRSALVPTVLFLDESTDPDRPEERRTS